MRLKTSTFSVPIALCAVGLCLFVLTGCKKKPSPEPPRHSPESYMNDAEFRKTISDDRKEMQRISFERQTRVDRMQALVNEHGEDEGKLQNVPEWVQLKREVKELNAQYEAAHKRQLATVRARIRPEAPKSADCRVVAPGSKTPKAKKSEKGEISK